MPKILHSLLPKSLHFWLPFTKSRFETHLSVDKSTRKVDEVIREELADAADGKRDNPVGEVIYLPEKKKSEITNTEFC